jgi:phosphopantothenoylcysteine decarboxylase/phosphopantothenate--cysteine ligase
LSRAPQSRQSAWCNPDQVSLSVQDNSRRRVLDGKRILLIVGGGIAAYKSLELIRLLAREGIGARVILTRAGAEFVTPLSLGSLSGDKVYQELFSLTDEAEMGHIELSRSADLVVVCPATADLMARAANGLANDLASTALLATDKPVLMVPAMNVRMWEHAATKRNVAQLRADGVTVMEPDVGPMACGEFGAGRLPEPDRIAKEVRRLLAGPQGHGWILYASSPTTPRDARAMRSQTRSPGSAPMCGLSPGRRSFRFLMASRRCVSRRLSRCRTR